jgi:hypothetical protein
MAEPISKPGPSRERPERVLVGTWRLVSWEARAVDGTVTFPFGQDAAGYLVYTADGRMFAQVMRPGRPRFAGGDLSGGTPEENAAAIEGYIAYGGTYSVQDGTVIHHIQMSLFPNWIGGEQRRSIAWDQSRLMLDTAPILVSGSLLVHRLVWERVSPPPQGLGSEPHS